METNPYTEQRPQTVDEFREEVLRLSEDPGSPTDAKIFSDLERAKVAVVRRIWPTLPDATRRRLVAQMVELGEEQIEYNFSRVLKVALRDEDAGIRATAGPAVLLAHGAVAARCRTHPEEAAAGRRSRGSARPPTGAADRHLRRNRAPQRRPLDTVDQQPAGGRKGSALRLESQRQGSPRRCRVRAGAADRGHDRYQGRPVG